MPVLNYNFLVNRDVQCCFNAVKFFLLLYSSVICESTICTQSLLENKFVFCRQSTRADAMP